MKRIIQSQIVLGILVAIVAVVVLTLSGVAATHSNQATQRMIAHTEKEVSGAVAKGCKVVREARTLKALICSKDVASSLGLQEDIQVFSMDSGANTQIRADSVQASGNNGDGRKVVILDTGYNYNHPELSSSYLEGKDFVNDDLDPMDDNGHGSHVAGIITADGKVPKAIGVAPATGIIAGKVLDASGSGYFSDVIAAIYWAVDNNTGVDAISMSLGTGAPYLYKGFCDSVLPDLTTAIKYAVDKGAVVVAAAGNSGSAGVSIPGCISYSTTVGAVNSSDTIASWSGRGSAVDITAPGVNIYSSWLGNLYATLSGTSMATPMVSGTVALIKFAHPEYTVAQVQNALFQTAKDLGVTGWDSTYGWGRVDALKAVTPYLSLSANPSSISTTQSSTITVSTSDKSSTVVAFTTNLGALSPKSCTTMGGSCTVNFSSTAAGTAIITASASGYTSALTKVTVTKVRVRGRSMQLQE